MTHTGLDYTALLQIKTGMGFEGDEPQHRQSPDFVAARGDDCRYCDSLIPIFQSRRLSTVFQSTRDTDCLDPEWSQPNEQGPGTYRESEHFTRETGIRVNHPSVPESTLAQLGLLRRLIQEGSSPDVLEALM